MKPSSMLFFTLTIGFVSVASLWAQDLDEKQADPTVKHVNRFSLEGTHSPRVDFAVSLIPSSFKVGDQVTLQIKATVDAGWHIGALSNQNEKQEEGQSSTIDFDCFGLKPQSSIFEANVPPKRLSSAGNSQSVHEGQVSWSKQFTANLPMNELVGKLEIQFQVCDHEKCLPPKTVVFNLQPKVPTVSRMSQSEEAVVKFPVVGKPVVIALTDCKKDRRKVKLGDVSVLSMMMGGGLQKEPLDLTGEINVGKDSFPFYLPKVETYRLVNSNALNTRFENDASYISIDHNRDGVISDFESTAMSRPFRVADSMFQVTRIDRTRKVMTLQQVEAPLSGAIVGRKIPPFRYETTEGTTVSDKSIFGKVTILDIWAVT